MIFPLMPPTNSSRTLSETPDHQPHTVPVPPDSNLQLAFDFEVAADSTVYSSS